MAKLDLEIANQRLQAGGIKIRIYEKVTGGPLYLRGTFPPKPESKKTRPYQQWISTGYRNNTPGIQAAIQMARKIDLELVEGRFDWAYWRNGPTEPANERIAYKVAILRLSKSWFEGMGETPSSLYTWAKDYESVFKHLDPDAPVDGAALLDWIVARSEPNTRARKRYCQAIKKLCGSAQVPIDLERLGKLAGHYGRPGTIKSRQIPTDEEIVQIWERLTDPVARWVWGIMATFGVRNFEVWFLDVSELARGGNTIQVKRGKGSRPRVAYPLPRSWIDQFGLRGASPLPAPDPILTNGQLGDRITHIFTNKGLPGPYNLRHAWRQRAIVNRIDPSVAAKSLGHSVQVSQKTYTAWITEQTCDAAFEEAWLGQRGESSTTPAEQEG